MSNILRSLIVRVGADTGEFSTAMKNVSKDLGGISKSLNNTGRDLSRAGANLTKSVTLPIVGIGSASVNAAFNFEAQMSRVQAISGATGDELELLNQQALDLGAATMFGATEAAEGMENLASAGFTTSEIMAAMPGLLDLAASSGEDLAMASDIAASTLRGFGLEAEEAGHVADVLAKLAADTNAAVADTGEAMKYVAPAAKAMGMSLEETAAAIGIMSDAGIKGSQAGTTLRGALTRLVKPTKQMYSVIDNLGLSFFDANGNMLSMEGIIRELEDGTQGLTQEQKNQAIATLFGQEALSGMLTLIDAGPDKLNELAKGLENSDGAAKSMADTMMNNGKGSIEQMMGSLETAGIKIGTALTPHIVTLAQKIGELADKFTAMSPEQQEMILKMAAFAAAIGPVLSITGKLTSGFGSLFGAASKVTGIISKLSKPAVAGKAAASLSGIGTAGTAASSGIMAAVGAAAPWVAAAAGVVVAGKEIYDHLNKDLIPEFELFDDTISESTKEALGSFIKMSEGATAQLEYLGLSGATVSEQLYADFTTNTNAMADEVISRLEKQKEDGIRILTEQLERQTDISEEEKEEAIRIATEKYDAEIRKATEGKSRIEEILLNAKETNRGITNEEKKEIEGILEKLKENSISLMSESQEEQEKILKKLKDNSERITAEMMSSVIKSSITQKDETIANANKQYEDVLIAAELLKRDGTAESIKLADNMIAESERQKNETIANAEEMHKKVLSELEAQGGDLIKRIDLDNGEIKSKWDELKEWFNNNPIVRFFKTIDDGSGAAAERNDRTNPLGNNNTVSWNAAGAIFTRPTVLPTIAGWQGFGEAGPEAVLPLSKLDGMLNSKSEIKHSGTIRVEGVNDQNQLMGVVDIVMDQLRREVRG